MGLVLGFIFKAKKAKKGTGELLIIDGRELLENNYRFNYLMANTTP